MLTIAKDPPLDPHKIEMAVSALYLYESGSKFEELLNRYMHHNIPINPYNPLSLEGVEIDGSFANITMPEIGQQEALLRSQPVVQNETERLAPVAGDTANAIQPLKRRRR